MIENPMKTTTSTETVRGNSPGMQAHHEGRQNETQENCQRDGNEDFLTYIERSNYQGCDGHIRQHGPRGCASLI
jgi:hypothetical protein